MKTMDELKKQVIGPSDLNESFNDFFDIMDDLHFRKLGTLLEKKDIKKSTELQSLLSSMQSMIGQVQKRKVNIIAPYLIKVAEHKLVHGFYKINIDPALMFTVVYFTDVKMGMFCMTKLGNESDYFRFSLISANQQKVRMH